MNFTRRLSALAALSIAALSIAHAETLSLDQAIGLAVEKNYALSLAREDKAAAVSAREGGIGPFLPSASASLNHGGPLDGTAPTTTLGAQANWEIFNGLQSYHAYHRLQSQEQAADLRERIAVETLIETVIDDYYDIVQLNQKRAAIKEQIAASQERARLAESKLEIGAGSRLDQLQSLADLNTDSSTYLDEDDALRKAKVKLNQDLARDVDLDFETTDSISPGADVTPDAWQHALSQNNTSIAEARAERDAVALTVDEARGRYLPDLNAGIAYNTAPSALNSNSSLLTGRDGFTYSVNLSVPIFDRLSTPTAVSLARINLRESQTRVNQAEVDAAAQFGQDRRQYEAAQRQIALGERNLQVARLQAEAAQERYKVGASSPLEFRDAQTKLFSAQVTLISARQSAKQAETAMRRLAGMLIRQAPAGGK